MPKASPASGSSSTSDPVPHSRPTLGEREQRAVAEVLAGGHPGQGPRTGSLEARAARWFGHPGGVATGSGSLALLLALESLQIGPGRRVAIPAYTCAAVLHAVERAGAEPVLLDCTPGGLAPDADALALHRPVDAVILVHPWGYPLDAAPWLEAVSVLIEDCAQSIGARRQGRVVGTTGQAAVVSFYATKMLCAGEGGLLTSADPAVLDRARDLRDYDGRAGYARRFNYKMSDLQAALAEVQWQRLPEFLERRKAIADRYRQALVSLDLKPVFCEPETEPSWYRFLCWWPGPLGPVLDLCAQRGVHCRRPVAVPLDRLLGRPALPHTAYAHEHVLSLPIYPTLGEREQERVVASLALALQRGGRTR